VDEVKAKQIERQVPRVFMTPAYVREVEPGTYAMYRDMVQEEDGKREKVGKSIGPLYLFRPAKQGEKEDFITSRGEEVIRLVRFWPPKEER
jgi:hypothetical protein